MQGNDRLRAELAKANAECERLRKENEALKKGASSNIRMKVREKGAPRCWGPRSRGSPLPLNPVEVGGDATKSAKNDIGVTAGIPPVRLSVGPCVGHPTKDKPFTQAPAFHLPASEGRSASKKAPTMKGASPRPRISPCCSTQLRRGGSAPVAPCVN